MKISKIERQKKKKNRYSIFIDEEFAFGVDENTLIKYNIKKGQEITKEAIKEIATAETFEKGKEKALRLLALRPRTRKEIITRLYPMEEALIDEVLAYLDSYNYLDDEAFARMYVKDALRLKGWGRKKIEYELKLKGVSNDIIGTLEISYEEEKKVATKVLYKRLKNRVWNEKEKQRTIQNMISKGFSYSLVKEVIQEFENNKLE